MDFYTKNRHHRSALWSVQWYRKRRLAQITEHPCLQQNDLYHATVCQV